MYYQNLMMGCGQGYRIVGSHSGVKLCRWTKSMLRGRGGCYKHTFYGIESHRCMETTPSLACANKCVFCWRWVWWGRGVVSACLTGCCGYRSPQASYQSGGYGVEMENGRPADHFGWGTGEPLPDGEAVQRSVNKMVDGGSNLYLWVVRIKINLLETESVCMYNRYICHLGNPIFHLLRHNSISWPSVLCARLCSTIASLLIFTLRADFTKLLVFIYLLVAMLGKYPSYRLGRYRG